MASQERVYSVRINGELVGMLHAVGANIRFVVDEAYAANPHRSVLGLRFEEDLKAVHRSTDRLPPWFSNLLPEGRLRTWIAEERGVQEKDELDLLVEVGHDLPGAVTIGQSEGAPPPQRSEREVLSRENGDKDNAVWRFSLAGVALKLSMLEKGERFTAPAVGGGGDWIVKLPDSQFPCVPQNEFAMMEFARLAGLDVPETRLVHRDELDDVPEHLWPSDEAYAYAVRRFDRTKSGGRVHIEDFAQVRGYYPGEKYTGAFETVAALAYRGRDARSLVEFAKRLAFTILIRNGDAHLKNWSLIYENPRVPRLSPAYDLVSTDVYRPPQLPEDLGLKFGKSRVFQTVKLSHFGRLERRLGATDLSLESEVETFVERAKEAWAEVADLTVDFPLLQQRMQSELNARATFLLRRG